MIRYPPPRSFPMWNTGPASKGIDAETIRRATLHDELVVALEKAAAHVRPTWLYDELVAVIAKAKKEAPL